MTLSIVYLMTLSIVHLMTLSIVYLVILLNDLLWCWAEEDVNVQNSSNRPISQRWSWHQTDIFV